MPPPVKSLIPPRDPAITVTASRMTSSADPACRSGHSPRRTRRRSPTPATHRGAQIIKYGMALIVPSRHAADVPNGGSVCTALRCRLRTVTCRSDRNRVVLAGVLGVRQPGCHRAISLRVGASWRRSPGSEVTTGWSARRAQITTWASAMSEVPLAASSLPTFVASTRPRLMTSVLGWRISRESRTCWSGRRMAWASTEAGTVTRVPALARGQGAPPRGDRPGPGLSGRQRQG